MDKLYITEKDIVDYTAFIKAGEIKSAIIAEDKFIEIVKIYSNIVYPGKSEYINFLRLGNSNFECFDYYNELYVDIPIDLLKNEDWQEVLQKQIDDKNKKQKIDGIKNILNQYLKIKDRAIDVAREYALLKDLNKFHIQDGTHTFMISSSDIEKGIITVLFELSSIAGEIDDQEVFIFPMELLVVDDWKEKLKEYHNSEAEFNKVSIRR